MRQHLNTTKAVIIAEWRSVLRNRVALTAGLLMLALTLAASLVSFEQMQAVSRERAALQQTSDTQWDNQPARHPHRVVHYGHYVFKPLGPLAFFDFGVDPYAGHTLYLEGHRQNSANFSAASQSSVLLRFGQLTPAFVLQVLTPLLIVFIAFSSVAREREQGQLRLLMSQGAPGGAVVAGKLAAHATVALLCAAPAFLALAAIGARQPAYGIHAALVACGYAAYLLLWSGLAVLVSAVSKRSRNALLTLVVVWIGTVVVMPRVMADVAARSIERPTRIETEGAIAKRLAALGDSHNPDDPHFAAFRASVLARFKVSRVEDLPVNYGGLVIAEGERLTSRLFEQTMREDFARQGRQAGVVDAAAIISPVLALRRLSTTLAVTDGASHAHFLLEAERYRYALIQALNKLHTEKVAYHNDRDQRLDSAHWKHMPRFGWQADDTATLVRRGMTPAVLVFALWIVLLGAAALLVARKLERSVA